MRALRRHLPSLVGDRSRSAPILTRLLPFLAIMALLVALVSAAHAQEATTDTSSDPSGLDDPPVALQQNSIGTLVSNLGQLDALEATIIEDSQQAQSFVAGPGSGGLGYRFQGIRVAARSSVLGGDVFVPEVSASLHRDANGLPGSRLHTLTVPGDFASTGEFAEYTLAAPSGTVIPGGSRYWVVFEALRETLYLGTTSSSAEDQVPPPVDGWSINNDRYLRSSSVEWRTVERVIEIAVLGEPQNTPEKLGGNESFDSESRGGIGSWEVGGLPSGGYWGSATSFTPGGDAGWYALSSITFGVSTISGGLFRVAIHGDDSDGPAAGALYVAYVEVPSGSIRDLDLTATFPDNATLEPGRKYWGVFDEVTGAGFYSLHLAANGNEDAGFASWMIGDTRHRINYLTATGFTWTEASDGPVQMSFYGYAAERVLVGAHGLRDTAADGPFLRFGTEEITATLISLPKDRTFDHCEPAFVAGDDTERSKRLCNLHPSNYYDHEWAGGRRFTTGPHPTGYTITGLGVDIDVRNTLKGPVDPRAAIYAVDVFSTREGSGDPSPPLASYQASSVDASPDRFAALTGSQRFQVGPDSAYVAYFSNVGAGYYETPNAGPKQDPGAAEGWALGSFPYGNRFVHPWGYGDDWNFGAGDVKRIPLNVHGWPNPLPNPAPPTPAAPLIINLGKTQLGNAIVSTTSLGRRAVAQPFRTGDDETGYVLRGVQIELGDFTTIFAGGLRAAIHADERGLPGASLHQLALQINPRPGLLTFHASASITLSASTTYWLVIDAAESATESNAVQVFLTQDTGVNIAARNWSLAGPARATMSDGSWEPTPNDTRLKMAILGEPTPCDDPHSADTSTSGSLVVDGSVEGRLCSHADVDWFRVELEVGVDYQFDASAVGLNGPVAPGTPTKLYLLKVYTDIGREVYSSQIPGSGFPAVYNSVDRVNSLPLRAEKTGVHYVSIQTWTAYREGLYVGYNLSAQSDDYPASTSTTAEVAAGDSLQNYVMRTERNYSSSSTSDVDWIRLTGLQQDDEYRLVYDVQIHGCYQHQGIIRAVYQSDGVTAVNTRAETSRRPNTCPDSPALVFTAPDAGDYYVAVTARGRGSVPFQGDHFTLTLTGGPLTSRSLQANSPATGWPGIDGTVRAGETLTATTDGIEDEDGLTGAVFSYQWIRNDLATFTDADIEEATGSTYTMTDDDEGKAIKVRVSFTDDAGNEESLTGNAMIAAPPLIIPDEETPPGTHEAEDAQETAETQLTAAVHDAPESHNGSEKFTFELSFSEEPATGFSYKTMRDHAFTVTAGTVAGARRLNPPGNIRWEISVTPDSNADVTVELPATTDCDAQGAICTEDGTMLSSPLKFTVKGPPLTASFESVPTSHNGSDNFKFRIAFSEELETGFSYKTLRDDHVFTVEGGTVAGARRLVGGSNIGWEITVDPDSNADVTVELPVTEDCDAQGAICTDDGRMLSNRLELTVSGPG